MVYGMYYINYSMYHVYMVMKKLENSYSTKQTLMDPMLCTSDATARAGQFRLF